ncbi:thiol-disulfide isomerase/thioredoxin [Cellulophaga sp. RHA_52]|uniref:thioredoxin family protein n=1 Tax=Cellulophaga sp. RHA_52 TaxID=1250036 RepID=UPI00119B141E|nr:thioredoxin family protein [Cellulophaga sp. RHA_52]TVZ08194.1 thiol-disulfide isomerase/thioredoxin [Cellulophaga sp. RHA_52]
MKKAKHTTQLLALFLFTVVASAQVPKDHNNRERLLGKISKSDLTKNSFENWFTPNYNDYKVDTETINTIKDKLKAYKIVAFMGTWCGDSKRETPPFYKALEAANYPMENFSLVAVDNAKNNYKKSPGGEEKGLNITHVPTFIFFKNGKEINRIVESPIISLEKDIKAIITGSTYIPNYAE